MPLFAPLLSLPIPENRYPPLHVSPQQQRQKTLETLIALLLEQAEQHPLLFIVEDLHWTDPTTLELLNLRDRADTDHLHIDGLNLSSHVSTDLESSFLFERGHGQPFIPPKWNRSSIA